MRWPSFSRCKFPFSSWAVRSAAATQQTKSVSNSAFYLGDLSFIKKITGNFTKQINEVGAKFIIVDKETIDSVKEACKGVHHAIQYLSVGEKVPGTVNFEDLLQDDGSGKHKRALIFKFL
jgi:hypothetical protein